MAKLLLRTDLQAGAEEICESSSQILKVSENTAISQELGTCDGFNKKSGIEIKQLKFLAFAGGRHKKGGPKMKV